MIFEVDLFLIGLFNYVLIYIKKYNCLVILNFKCFIFLEYVSGFYYL